MIKLRKFVTRATVHSLNMQDHRGVAYGGDKLVVGLHVVNNGCEWWRVVKLSILLFIYQVLPHHFSQTMLKRTLSKAYKIAET